MRRTNMAVSFITQNGKKTTINSPMNSTDVRISTYQAEQVIVSYFNGKESLKILLRNPKQQHNYFSSMWTHMQTRDQGSGDVMIYTSSKSRLYLFSMYKNYLIFLFKAITHKKINLVANH